MSFKQDNNSAFKPIITGLIPYKVVHINPSVQELNDFGFRFKDVNYTGENQEGDPQGIVSFCLTNIPFRIGDEEIEEGAINLKLDFYITDKAAVTQDGRTWYINARGHTRLAQDVEDLNNYFNAVFNNEGVRESYKGEGDLTNFLRSWLNFNIFADCSLEDVKALIKGDVKEIVSLQQHAGIVKVLTGLKAREYEKDGETKISFEPVGHQRVTYPGNQDTTYRGVSFEEDAIQTVDSNDFMAFKKAAIYTGFPKKWPYQECLVEIGETYKPQVPEDPGNFEEELPF